MKTQLFSKEALAAALMSGAIALMAMANSLAPNLDLSNPPFFIGAILMFISGLLLLVVIVAPRTVGGLAHVRKRKRHSRRWRCLPRFAGLQDLPKLHALYTQEFGKDAPTLEQMELWYSVNDRIFRIIENVNPNTGVREIVGSYKLVPLRASGLWALRTGGMTIPNFTEDHICKRKGRPQAWYVGDVVSTSELYGRRVMDDLCDHFGRDILHRDPEVPILARALSQQGLEYLESFGFRPALGDNTIQGGQMCVLESNQTCRYVRRLEDNLPLRPQWARRRRR